MDDIGLAGAPAHVAVRLIGEVESLLHHGEFFLVPATDGSGLTQPLPFLADEIIILYGEFRKAAHEFILCSSS